MKIRLSTCLLTLGLALGSVGCEKKKEVTDEVGGAAKGQLDKVQEKANAAAEKVKEKTDQAAKTGDEGGW